MARQHRAAQFVADVPVEADLLPQPEERRVVHSVVMARAGLVDDPAVIPADEPTGNLDLRTGREIIELLSSMKQDRGVTVITATHDMKMLAASDRVVWITDGVISRIQRREEMEINVGTMDGKEE